ncbi:MAG: biotin/lipoyl-binding protein [Sphingomonadaceae bacterium]|nr:biotin/lipoyl-binding protein [Sphingomonadaceae bacterium]
MAKMTLKLPKMATSMQNGTIVEWLVQPGDTVAQGQAIYVIETEKTSTEVESPFAGRITPLVAIGDLLPIGTPIAEIET